VEAVSPLSAAVGTAAVLAELNKGSDVTKGLRKVPKEEMTHKNPSLRASSVVPAASSGPGGMLLISCLSIFLVLSSDIALSLLGKKPVRPVKPSALAGKKPSKFELEGTKWAVVR
jgi:adenylyl cyclase-associated protein